MDRQAWWATVHRVTKEPDMTERLTLSFSFLSTRYYQIVQKNCSENRGKKPEETDEANVNVNT